MYTQHTHTQTRGQAGLGEQGEENVMVNWKMDDCFVHGGKQSILCRVKKLHSCQHDVHNLRNSSTLSSKTPHKPQANRSKDGMKAQN